MDAPSQQISAIPNSSYLLGYIAVTLIVGMVGIPIRMAMRNRRSSTGA